MLALFTATFRPLGVRRFSLGRANWKKKFEGKRYKQIRVERTATECGEKARASYQRNLIPREDDADEQLGSWQLQPGNEGGFGVEG